MVHGYKTYTPKAHLLKVCFCYLLLGGITLLPSRTYAQEVPVLEVDAVSVRNEVASSKSRLDIYTQIAFSNLTFINTANGFEATYEVEANVVELDDRNRRGALVQSPIWDHTAVVSTFAQTQAAQQFDYTTHSLVLAPGRYLIEFTVTDENSQGTFVRELPVTVRDLSNAIALSDIILLKDFDEETQTIYPHISDQIGSNQMAFEIFYEIYADRSRSVKITREVVPSRKGDSALIKAGRTLLGLKDKEADAGVVYTDSESTTLSRGRHQIVSTIPVSEFELGDYLIRVRIEDDEGTLLDVAEQAFSVQWNGLAAHLLDLDQAIDQLIYHAKSKELQAIKNAPSYEERLKRFEEFWKKRDPTPNTLRNERMEEYYYRIDYANRMFGSVTPGWRTDRGHVLILHGYPDDMERQSFSFGSEPWEVWYYYRIGLQFIFVDKTGFGDYELLIPIWDERNRIR